MFERPDGADRAGCSLVVAVIAGFGGLAEGVTHRPSHPQGKTMVGYATLILLRHGRCRPFDTALAPQHGHRGKVFMSSRIKWARMVAIEFGMWRSGRAGGASGSIIVG